MATRNKDSEVPTDVCKECKGGKQEKRADGSTPADSNSCCFDGERLDKLGQTVGNFFDGPLENKCPKRTQRVGYNHFVDGCSAPGPYPSDPMQTLPYPTGLHNQGPTAFGSMIGSISSPGMSGELPCNKHDICYQSCAAPGASMSATREACDDGMKTRMDNVCAAAYPPSCPANLSTLECVDYHLQRADCYTYSSTYWSVLRGVGFFAAFKGRQEEYCQCCP